MHVFSERRQPTEIQGQEILNSCIHNAKILDSQRTPWLPCYWLNELLFTGGNVGARLERHVCRLQDR